MCSVECYFSLSFGWGKSGKWKVPPYANVCYYDKRLQWEKRKLEGGRKKGLNLPFPAQ